MNASYDSIHWNMDDAAISLRGLTKRFGDLVAVDTMDLEIAK